MIYQTMILVLVPMLMANCNHISKNQSDVIVTYSNHAEAESKPNQVETKTEIPKERPEKPKEQAKSEEGERNSEEVIFVPNEREIKRNEDYLVNTPIRIEDFMARRTMDDVMDNGNVRVETEPPNDIIFLSGKNNENENTKEPKKETYGDTRRSGTETENVILKLNCTNLDCNSTIESVCGGKVEHKQWRYRLFLNECFFRKVNCHFKHSVNRYHQVPIDKCKNIGAHAAARPSNFQLFPPAPAFGYHVKEKPVQLNYTRRSFSSRRSHTVSVDGKSCSHPCPVTCPDEYEPECAVSSAGQRRVFVNHCKLDHNSCTFSIVWHKRPLSECVGGKKADMRQNRGFIDWMQRVGIVDNKGRLVLS